MEVTDAISTIQKNSETTTHYQLPLIPTLLPQFQFSHSGI